ncbi:cryptochrome/photolyase family protein [Tepidamorphus sp. 3E244]|uniref:cryptochrome/photolyase family protein n=1 Tax=Tepidamorphus sp. 3E244 TaxID=3385498 RepID=UPI0038FC50CA
MPDAPAIAWLRNDLRLEDNPALAEAARAEGGVVVVYILDEESEGLRAKGSASRWWLHHSLARLSGAIADKGGRLVLRSGNALNHLLDIANKTGAEDIHWNRRYGPGEFDVDTQIKDTLKERDLNPVSHPGNLLVEPWEVKTQEGNPYKVFTPFWRSAREHGWRDTLHAAPREMKDASGDLGSDDLDDWKLLPTTPNWAENFSERWQPGEDGARGRLRDFIDSELDGYGKMRDRPDKDHTSRLSAHLHHGEISPHTIVRAVNHAVDKGDVPENDAAKFLSEIGWREFSHNLLYNFPKILKDNLQEKFDNFPWEKNDKALTAWQRGRTGYPIVDAGMRELWRDGIIHNRIRMVVASFLIKDLLIDWRTGEDWFWDTLLDADLANNTASWQWVAGSGADAAPYFRVFNPVLQGEKFDPKGDYVRRHVPELADMPDKYIHKPWKAPKDVLEKASVTLGDTYPEPIVDHGEARDRALKIFEDL